MGKYFIFEVHYGGRFENDGLLSYNGGKVQYIEGIDADVMSFFELESIVVQLGYGRTVNIYYSSPLISGNEALKKISDDIDLIEMFEVHKRFSSLKIFIVEEVTMPEDVYVPMLIEEKENAASRELSWFELPSEIVEFSVFEENEVLQATTNELTRSVLEKEAEYDEEFSDVDSVYAPNDELRSLCGSSDDEEVYSKYQDFDPQRDLEDVELAVGLKFATAPEFRLALRHYAVKNNFDIKFTKNEKKLITAKCKSECGWRIRASQTQSETCLSIKTFIKDHDCTGIQINSQTTSTYIANRYLGSIRENPNWESSAMRQTVIRELRSDISIDKIYRSKRKAKEMIEGNHGEQYSNLRKYCKLIQETNPGSVAKISNYPSETEPRRFKRLFLSYEAMHRDFRAVCRPFIGVDGTFLKGPYGGHLLSAIGIDGNDKMFPLAFAIVEAENRDSWSWFMEELMDIVGPPNGLTFMSDRQKGLLQTFNDVLKGADHRFCVRHMHDNFKKKFSGLQLKAEVWNAARAYNVLDFEKHMQRIKDINVDAYDWLMKVPLHLWARAHFPTISKCNLVINNMCESWNSVIRKAREKPIITMLEWIRKYLMNRFQKKRNIMATHNGLLCPKIQRVLEEYKNLARECVVGYAGYSRYEVDFRGVNEDVKMDDGTCTCREWDVTGIPCLHAVASILFMRGQPEMYVAGCYHKDTYLKIYAPIMYPMPLKMMAKYSTDLIIPPLYPKPPGRPKKARRKASDEATCSTKLKKSYVHLKCSKCLQFGHNSRTCKVTESVVREKPPRGKGGRPPLRTYNFLGNTSSGECGVGHVEVKGKGSSTASVPFGNENGNGGSVAGRGRGRALIKGKGLVASTRRGRGSVGGSSEAGRLGMHSLRALNRGGPIGNPFEMRECSTQNSTSSPSRVVNQE